MKTNRILITPETGPGRKITQVLLVRNAADKAGEASAAAWLAGCGAVRVDSIAKPVTLAVASTGSDTVFYVFSPQEWDAKSQVAAVQRYTAKSSL